MEGIVHIQLTHTHLQELLTVAVIQDVVGMIVVFLHLLQIVLKEFLTVNGSITNKLAIIMFS